MFTRSPYRSWVLTLLVAGLLSNPLPAETGSNGLPSASQLAALIAQAEAQPDRTPEQRNAVSEPLGAALQFAEQAAAEKAAMEAMLQQAETLDEELARLRQEETALPSPPLSADTPVSDAEAWVLRQQTEMDRLIERRNRLEREVERLRHQPEAIRQEMEVAAPAALLPPAEMSAWTEPSPANAVALRDRWAYEALRVRGRRLEVELNTLDARLQIALAERQATAMAIDRLQAALEEARDWLSARRLSMTLQASTDTREMRKQLEGAAPSLLSIAEENVRLAQVLEQDAADMRAIQTQLREQHTRQENVQQAVERVTQILAIDNLPVAYSEQLREERQRLTWVRQMELGARQRQEQTALKRVQQIEVRERLRALQAPEARRLAGLPGAEGLSQEERQLALTLLDKQRELLVERERALDEYQRIRGQLDLVELQILSDGRIMLDKLDQRLIWTRSLRAVNAGWFKEQQSNLPRLISERDRYFGAPPQRWRLLNLQKLPLLAGIAVLLLALQLAKRIRRRMADLAERVNRLLTDRLAYTIEALLWTLLLAAIWPSAFAYLGHLLQSASQAELLQAAGYGLMPAAWALFGCCFLRETCKPSGLAHVHFLWPEPARLHLYKAAGNARWLYPPLVALTFLFVWPGEEWLRSGPARITFLLMLGLLTWQMHRLFRRRGGVLEPWLEKAPAFLQRLAPLCGLVMTSTLGALVVAVVRGYFYTARVILLHLVYLAVVLVGALLVNNLALRWMRVARRRYAVAQIRKRRREAKTAGTETKDGESAGIQLKDLEPYDVDALNDQTRRLIRLGVVVGTFLVLLTVFRPLLPALGILESVTLWQRADGAVISLHHLLLAVLAAFLTFAAGRNIPGLLEMTLLPLVPMKNSSRFALVTLVRYVITIVGMLIAFGAIGIGWGQVQWLAAAITVGLGFGLQEIFANFVSGIIILFEQPIRVGDIVTIDGTTGMVSRIQMRATTITDWDRKELIVPNKEFVTGRLLNWTLSDSVTRVLIPVGVAYGSDVALALDTLVRVAAEHPAVMSEPKPLASFEGFGNSTLDLSLRAYLPNLENRLATTTELHIAIDKSFRELGIEIAFPQQDLHVRSMDEGVARLLGERRASKSTGDDRGSSTMRPST